MITFEISYNLLWVRNVWQQEQSEEEDDGEEDVEDDEDDVKVEEDDDEEEEEEKVSLVCQFSRLYKRSSNAQSLYTVERPLSHDIL